MSTTSNFTTMLNEVIGVKLERFELSYGCFASPCAGEYFSAKPFMKYGIINGVLLFNRIFPLKYDCFLQNAQVKC